MDGATPEAVLPDCATPTRGRRRRVARTMALFCLGTVAFTAWRDLAVPHVRDVEVWGGFELRGVWALATAPLHWAIFALGAWAFWRQRDWIWSAAALYTLYVATSHLIWSEASPNGQGWPVGLLQAALLCIPAWLLWRARPASGRRC